MPESFRLARAELYELLWSEPMTSLARRFGLSDVALAKTCRRHLVPRPPRGYWQKKRHGKHVRRVPLRPLAPGERERLETVTIVGRQGLAEDAGPVADQARYEKDHAIVVLKRLRRPHPLVKETAEHFRRGSRGHAKRSGRHLDVRVNSKSLPRALRVLDALIKALEARGFSVTVQVEQDESRTLVSVNGEKLAIRLEERRRQAERPPTAWERSLAGRVPWLARPRKELVYTGRLVLRIDEWADGLPKSWADGKRRRVEERLNAFVVGLVRTAESKKAQRAERERHLRRWEEEAQKRLEATRRAEEERQRARQLEEGAAAWAKAEEIRRYLAAVRARAEQVRSLQHDSELAAWLLWAEDHAKRIDPIQDALGGPREPRSGSESA